MVGWGLTEANNKHVEGVIILIRILVGNTYSQIHDYKSLPSALIRRLNSVTSYFIPQARFTKAFITGRWDGKTYLITSTGKFPTGLVYVMHPVFKEFGQKVEYEDKRTKPINIGEIGWEGIELRDYQVEAVKTAMQYKRGMIALPTRTGKTFCAARLIYETKCRTLYIVDGKESLYQTRRDLMKCLRGVNVTLVGDGNKNYAGDVVVGLIPSLRKIKELRKECFGMLICDEIHKGAARTVYQFCMQVDAYYRFGISGTPFREDNQDLKMVAMTGKIIVKRTVGEMWDKGVIMKPKVVWMPVQSPRVSPLLDYRLSYEQGVIKNVYRAKLIRELVKKHLVQGDQILISIENIEHGEYLMKMLSEFKPAFMRGTMPRNERMRLFNDFQAGKIKLMIATRLLNQSVTIPDLSVLINAAGRKSGVELIQKIGRVQGIGNKDSVIVYDFVDKHCDYLFRHAKERAKKLKKAGYEQEGLEYFK